MRAYYPIPTTVSHIVFQVPMGILPVGHAATLLPTEPPSIP